MASAYPTATPPTLSLTRSPRPSSGCPNSCVDPPGTQGKKMAEHARFSVASGVPVYFCDARSPWQRGSNENTNGLLR